MIKLYPYFALIFFGFVDYVGYNIATQAGKIHLIIYRVFQTLLQITLMALLWKYSGFWSAFVFMFLWWTFNADFVFYGCAAIFKWFSDGADFKRDVLHDKVTWAYWTPLGLILHGGKHEIITGQDLIAQAGLGFIGAILISVFL